MFHPSKLPGSIKNQKNGMVPVTVAGFSRMVPEFSKLSSELQMQYRETFKLKLDMYRRIFPNSDIIHIDDYPLEQVYVCLGVYDWWSEVNLRCNKYRISSVIFWYAVQMLCWFMNINVDFAKTQMENYAEYEMIMMEMSERDIGRGTVMRKENLQWRLMKSTATGIMMFAFIEVISRASNKPIAESMVKEIFSYFTGATQGAVSQMNVGDNIRGISRDEAAKYNQRRRGPSTNNPGVGMNEGPQIPRARADNGASVFSMANTVASMAEPFIRGQNKGNKSNPNTQVNSEVMEDDDLEYDY